MNRPTVSVIVLSHRFDMAIDAMRSVKAQTYPEDHIELLLKHATAPYYPEKFNEAWQGASGTYLVFLPDDDRLEPTFVHTLVNGLDGHGVREHGDLAYSDYFSEKDGYRFQFPFPPEVTTANLRMWCYPHMTFMVRTAFWRAVGGWDGTLLYADWDASIRMLQAHAKTVHVPQQLYFRSVHGRAGSVLMSAAAHEAALAALQRKHAEFFQQKEVPDSHPLPDAY